MSNTTTLVTKTPATQNKPSALTVMANRLNVEPAKLLATLKSTVFQKATDDEMLALVVVANEYQLNPFLKEIYAFPAKGGGIVPIVSVDGWNKMLIRQENFDGIEFEFSETQEGELVSCTAIISVKGRSKPVKITEYLNECKRNTEPWNNMPRRMLRNRTLCQAARVAFGFSGVYNDDEAAPVIEVQASAVPVNQPSKMIVAPESDDLTPQKQLEGLLVAEGYTFSHLQKFGQDSGNIPDADSIPSFAEVPADVAKRLLKAKTGLLNALKVIKEGETK